MLIEGSDDRSVTIRGDEGFPVNAGRMCVKGFTAAETLTDAGRLMSPLLRDAGGEHRVERWDVVLDEVVDRLRRIRQEYGPGAVGVFGSGAMTNEKAYLLGKFARVALGTPNIDYNGRFCMSSAAAAANRALGVDRGIPFPLEDLVGAEVIVLVGANVVETMPPLVRYLEGQRNAGGKLVVVDPLRSATAEFATHHLPVRPGSDIALANGLLHLLIRDGGIDRDFIARRTEGFERVRRVAAGYWPGRVERLTGVGEGVLTEVAALLGRARSVVVLTGRGPEQQSQGVNNTLAFIDLALALGMVGRRNAGYGCITGQGNGQGGREHGQKTDQLPGYRGIADPEARRHVAEVWGIDEDRLPGAGLSGYEMLATLGTAGGVRALLVFGSNPVVSAPRAIEIERRMKDLDLLLVSDFFLSETAALADFVLPSAQWAEEDGTMTNLEGRVIRRRRAFPPPPNVRTDIEIICALAERMGVGNLFSYSDPREVFGELRRASAGGPADYAGITYDRIEREDGVFWPCPAEDHPGTPRLFIDGFPTASGRARFHGVTHGPPAEVPDSDYPLYLTTGRILAHYQTGTQTHRIAKLETLSPRPLAEIHPTTAARYGIAEGEDVTFATRRGTGRFGVSLSPGIRPDTVFLPFHWSGEASANRLTSPALDPVSRMPEFKVCAVRIEPTSTNGDDT